MEEIHENLSHLQASVRELDYVPVENVVGHQAHLYMIDKLAILGGQEASGCVTPLQNVMSLDLKSNVMRCITSPLSKADLGPRRGFASCVATSFARSSSATDLSDSDSSGVPMIVIFGGLKIAPSNSIPSLLSGGEKVGLHSSTETMMDDFFAFIPSEGIWVPLPAHLDSNVPLPRMNHSLLPWPPASGLAAAEVETEGFFVYGGVDNQGRALDDLWYFDLKSITWTPITPTKSILPKRYNHAATWRRANNNTNNGSQHVWELVISGGWDTCGLPCGDTWTVGVSPSSLPGATVPFELVSVMQRTTVPANAVSVSQSGANLPSLSNIAGHQLLPLGKHLVLVGGVTSTAQGVVANKQIIALHPQTLEGTIIAVRGDGCEPETANDRADGFAVAVCVATDDAAAVAAAPAPLPCMSDVSMGGILMLGGGRSRVSVVTLSPLSATAASASSLLVIDPSMSFLPAASLANPQRETAVRSRLLAAFEHKFLRSLQGAIVAQQTLRRLRVMPPTDTNTTSQDNDNNNTMNEDASRSAWHRFVSAKFPPDHARLLRQLRLDLHCASAANPPDAPLNCADHPLLAKAGSSLLEDDEGERSDAEAWPVSMHDDETANATSTGAANPNETDDPARFAGDALPVRTVSQLRPPVFEDLADPMSLRAAAQFGLPRLLQYRRALAKELEATPADSVELFGASVTHPHRHEEDLDVRVVLRNATQGLNMTELTAKLRASLKRDRGSSSRHETHPAFVRTGLDETVFHTASSRESVPTGVARTVSDLSGQASWPLGAIHSLTCLPFLSPPEDAAQASHKLAVRTIRTLKGKVALAIDGQGRGLSPLQLTGLLREVGGRVSPPDHAFAPEDPHVPWPGRAASFPEDSRVGARFLSSVLALGQGALVLTKTLDAITIGLYSTDLLEQNASSIGLVPHDPSLNAGAQRHPIAVPVAAIPLAGLAARGGVPLSDSSLSNAPLEEVTGARLTETIMSFLSTSTQTVAPPAHGPANVPWFAACANGRITAGGALMPSHDVAKLNDSIKDSTQPKPVAGSAANKNNKSSTSSVVVTTDGTLKQAIGCPDGVTESAAPLSLQPYVPSIVVGPVLGQPDLAAQSLIASYGPLRAEELAAEVLRLYRLSSAEATRVIVFDLNFDCSALASTDFDVFTTPVSEQQSVAFALNAQDRHHDFQAGPACVAPSLTPRLPHPCLTALPVLVPAEGPTGPTSPTHRTRARLNNTTTAAAAAVNGKTPQPSPALGPSADPATVPSTGTSSKSTLSTLSSASRSLDAPPPRITGDIAIMQHDDSNNGDTGDHAHDGAEVLRVSEPTSLGIIDHPVSLATLAAWSEVAVEVNNQIIAHKNNKKTSSKNHAAADHAAVSTPLHAIMHEGALCRQELYLNARLGARALQPPFDCLLDSARLVVDAKQSLGGALRDSQAPLNVRFPFWSSLTYGPDHCLSSLLFWGSIFSRGGAVAVQKRMVLPVPPVQAVNDLLKPLPTSSAAAAQSSTSQLLEFGRDAFDAPDGPGCPVHPTAHPRVFDLNALLEETTPYVTGCTCASQSPNAAWQRPYDLVKSCLKDVVELPFFSKPSDYKEQGWIMIGHLNDLDDTHPELMETGVLLYQRGRLVSRLDVPFPCAPVEGAGLFRHDGSGVEGLLSNLASAHHKLTVLVGVPLTWQVDYSGRRFVAEGSLQWASQVRSVVLTRVREYLTLLHTQKIDQMVSKARSALKQWVVGLSAKKRGALALYTGSRKLRTNTDHALAESDPNALLYATRRAGPGQKVDVHAGHFAIMDNDKLGQRGAAAGAAGGGAGQQQQSAGAGAGGQSSSQAGIMQSDSNPSQVSGDVKQESSSSVNNAPGGDGVITSTSRQAGGRRSASADGKATQRLESINEDDEEDDERLMMEDEEEDIEGGLMDDEEEMEEEDEEMMLLNDSAAAAANADNNNSSSGLIGGATRRQSGGVADLLSTNDDSTTGAGQNNSNSNNADVAASSSVLLPAIVGTKRKPGSRSPQASQGASAGLGGGVEDEEGGSAGLEGAKRPKL